MSLNHPSCSDICWHTFISLSVVFSSPKSLRWLKKKKKQATDSSLICRSLDPLKISTVNFRNSKLHLNRENVHKGIRKCWSGFQVKFYFLLKYMFHADCSVTFHDSQQQHDATNAKSPTSTLLTTRSQCVSVCLYANSVCSSGVTCFHMVTNTQPITAANTWRRTSDKEKKTPLVQGNAAESVKKKSGWKLNIASEMKVKSKKKTR